MPQFRLVGIESAVRPDHDDVLAVLRADGGHRLGNHGSLMSHNPGVNGPRGRPGGDARRDRVADHAEGGVTVQRLL